VIERLRRFVRARRRAAAGDAPGKQQRVEAEETRQRLDAARERLKQTVPPPEDSAAESGAEDR
jgi:hypothetical protein